MIMLVQQPHTVTDLVGQHGSWYTVSNGVDVRDTGLEPVVHFQPASVVCLGHFAAYLL